MRLLRNLLPRRNPTAGWVQDSSRRLELNLDSSSLCGVPLGDPFERLAFLGPARTASSGSELFEFPSIGVVAEREAGRVIGLFVVPIPDGLFEVAPYTGKVVLSGEPVPVDWISREQDVVAAFGSPTRRDHDAEETVLFYELGDTERQIELTPEGRIKTIAIFSCP